VLVTPSLCTHDHGKFQQCYQVMQRYKARVHAVVLVNHIVVQSFLVRLVFILVFIMSSLKTREKR